MSAKLPLAFCLCVCFVSQSCLTLCSPMDCSPPGSSVHGIFQARLLEWDAISYSRGSSWPRDQADSLPLSLLWSPVSLGTALNLEISLRIDNCVFQSMNMINVFIFYLGSILFLLSLYMVFPLVVYRCESWTIKKAKCRRIDVFGFCWRKLLTVLDSKEIKPASPKENQLWILIEGLLVKLQYIDCLMRRASLLEKWCIWFLICCLTCHSFPSKEQASFNFMAAITVHSDFGAQENKVCHCFHFFPFYLPWSDGTRCHDLSFLNVEF